MTFESNDEEVILKKVTPLFDAMLLQSLNEKGEETVKIFADHISRIITSASQDNTHELSRALQSTITPVIVEAIDDNKDKMIDALYPIMGGMISKYVSQALKEFIESINEKVEDGLSVERYKRKVKAKVSGVSESELLLQESAEAHVSSLFIVHKNSGLLISEAHLAENEMSDAHMVASMASAIKDFINDWIQQSQEHTEIEILSYGNSTLYIDSAGSVYIVAFLDHVPNHEFRSDINTFFADLLKEHSRLFQSFDGDDSSAEVIKLSKKMHDFLALQTRSQKPLEKHASSTPSQYIFLFLGLLFLGFIGYSLQQWLVEYQLTSQVREHTGYELQIDSSYDGIRLTGTVTSFEDAISIEKIIAIHSDKPIDDDLSIPVTTLGSIIKKGEGRSPLGTTQLERRLASVEKKIEEQVALLDEIDSLTLYRKKMVKKLVKAFEGRNDLDLRDGFLEFSSNAFFAKGSSVLRAETEEELKTVFEKYIETLMQDPETKTYLRSIVIEGHTDSDGSYAFNLDLSYRRALAMMNFLLTSDLMHRYDLRSYLTAVGRADKELIRNGDGLEDKRASRRIKIGLELKNSQILEQLADIVDER